MSMTRTHDAFSGAADIAKSKGSQKRIEHQMERRPIPYSSLSKQQMDCFGVG